jgi:hypothetical protein
MYLSGYSVKVDLETKEEADIVVQNYEGHMLDGRRIQAAICKPPLKYTASWDTGRGAGHQRTMRDDGSAVRTKFEEVRLDPYIIG